MIKKDQKIIFTELREIALVRNMKNSAHRYVNLRLQAQNIIYNNIYNKNI